MANIGLNTLFPSARFLSTDSSGDIQELYGTPAVDASDSIQGIQIDAVAEGAEGNGITFEILENQSADGVSLTDSTISLNLLSDATDYKLGASTEVSAVTQVDASDTIQGIHLHAVADGADGNGIAFNITESNGSDSLTLSGSTITLGLHHFASDYKLNEYSIDVSGSTGHTSIPVGAFIYFVSDDTFNVRDVDAGGTNVEKTFTAGTSLEVIEKDGNGRPVVLIDGTKYGFLVTNFKVSWGERLEKISTLLAGATSDITAIAELSIVGDDADNLSGTGTITLNNGVNGQTARTIPSISSLLDGASTSITDLVTFTITGADEDTLSDAGSVTLSSGQNEVLPDLTPDKKYLLVSIDDIHDLEDSETADGRKILYGILESASTNLANSDEKSSSLVINRGNLILLSETQLRRSYNITATLDILGSDLSNES